MGKFVAKESGDFTRPHFQWFDGEYLGFEITASQKYNNDQVKFRLQFPDEEREQWVYATARVTPKTKLGRILTKWGGIEVEGGTEIDFDEETGVWEAEGQVILEPGDRVGVMYGEQEKDPEKTTEVSFRRTPDTA